MSKIKGQCGRADYLSGVLIVKTRKPLIAVGLLVGSSFLFAQSSTSLISSLDSEAIQGGGHAAVAPEEAPAPAITSRSPRPFSRVAFGAGFSPLGVQMALTTNLNQHFNLRSTGNLFSYSTSFTTSGIPANAKLNLKSAGTAVDIYPFHKGFRISPGLLFYNANQATADASVPGGTSFTLNNHTYYSANANPTTGAKPVDGTGQMSLHTTNPAFSMTTGWGNTLPRKGHWSFPFEVGVAFTGAPTVKANLNGWACHDNAQTLCTDINSKTDPIALEIQSNLQIQIAKWTHDVEPLKTYPIASFGVAYSFGLGSASRR
jgi:hypothetical protein